VEEILKIRPNYNLETFSKKQSARFKDKAYVERTIDEMRNAGLPEHPPLPLPDKPSIAVVPFENMSGDPEQKYFSDGITEEIITALSKTPKLFVIARTSSFKYKGKETDVRTIGRELGVRYVLEGSVRKAGDKVRVTAQLIDAKTNRHIWAERYDRDLKEIFAIQDDITKNIITSIQVKLTLGEQGRLSAEGTKNLDAYLSYLQAWDHLRHFNKEDNMKARRLAEKSIALDPEYDKGYAVLASVEITDIWLGASKSPKEALTRCMKLAKKSIAIRDSPMPHRVLAMTYLLFRKHNAAMGEAKKAIEMGPNYADAYMTLGIVYMHSDMEEAAVPVLQKAIRLNPYPPSAYHDTLAWSYYWLGKYDAAVAEGKRAISLNPKDFNAHLCLICVHLSMGQEKEAREHAAEVLKIDPSFSIDKAERTVPLKNRDKLKRIIEHYRMAGLPD
jgi:adenylate cyclase